jgi:hypothetical protein
MNQNRSNLPVDRGLRYLCGMASSSQQKLPWKKVGIEMPEEWQEAVRERANAARIPMRYLYLVAVDRVLKLPRNHLRRLARELEDCAETDWPALVAMHHTVLAELPLDGAAAPAGSRRRGNRAGG